MNNTNSKMINIGVAWIKKNKLGQDFLSCVAGDKQKGLTLVLRNAQGQEVEVTNFMAFFQNNKKSEKAPDLSFVVSVNEQ